LHRKEVRCEKASALMLKKWLQKCKTN